MKSITWPTRTLLVSVKALPSCAMSMCAPTALGHMQSHRARNETKIHARDFLLAIIESSFGSVQPFNNIVRTLMKRVEPMRADLSIAAASAAPPPDGDGSEGPLPHGTPMRHNNVHRILGAGTQGDVGTNSRCGLSS